ncbi:MAG: DNA translocase FtsK 4TM domain-containing protein [Nitrospirae bacterium]|nr:DNA translocase FtsK 4TM domain-containing protein [Nitrospirota bacterium]
MERESRIKDEIIGILAILIGLVVIISIISHNRWDQSLFTYNTYELKNLLGRFGANLSEILLQAVGLSSYIIPIIFLIFGIKKVFGKATNQKPVLFIVTVVILIISTSSLFTLFLGGDSGGAAGVLITELTNKTVSSIGSLLLFATLTLVSLMYIIQFSVADLVRKTKSKIIFGTQAISAVAAKKKEKEQPQIKENSATSEIPVQPEIAEPVEMPEIPSIQEPLPLAPEARMKPKEKPFMKPSEKVEGDYKLPGVDLLKDPSPSKSKPTKEELLQQSELLEKKLQDYSIEGKVTYVSPGPVVTMFEFEPAPGIKINKIMSLSDDLAMAMKATSIRISPIHGRSTLGIEVPNQEREDVCLKELIVSDIFRKSPSKLTIALGKDIFGTPVMADLSKMPHLLIAGATGSGKSVGMNSIVLSLLYRATPKEVKMLMIDPKMLELSAYAEIPHLLMPVITLPKEASNALKMLVFEMERRYRLLAESGARNIETYNKKFEISNFKFQIKESDFESHSATEREPLPYIVIFIDELADLMFASGHEVEDSIARLAQMARAAGIHLILATQRPSVDVITGIIKANFPSRISFQVSSKLDSRIILDTYGADQLLGKGDMLFVSPGKKIKRIHGAYVSEEEMKHVVDFIKTQGGPDYTLFEDITIESREGELSEDKDELYLQAKDIVLSTGQASISYIQRRMKIGYNRAARIMEMLEEEGVVGPPGEAGKPREILWKRKQ